jgi:hypothetical protein
MAGIKTKEIPDVTALEDLHALRIGLLKDYEDVSLKLDILDHHTMLKGLIK